MTEITDNSGSSTLHPSGHEAPNVTDFLLALFGTPFLSVVLFVWLLLTPLLWFLLIPVFAVWYGYLPWLLFGGPALWITLKYMGPSPWTILSSLGANVLGTPIYYTALRHLTDKKMAPFGNSASGVVDVMLWGIPFSFIWGSVFWLSYRNMARQRTNNPSDIERKTPC